MKRKFEVVFVGDLKDFDAKASVDYWQKQSAEKRLSAVWELVVDCWKPKGKDLNELRFQRTTALLKRI